MPKMIILNEQEIKEYDYPPYFQSADRKQFLTLPVGLQKQASTFHTLTNKVCFHLTFAYFKACGRFFSPVRFRDRDIEFVCRRMGVFSFVVDKTTYDAATFSRHKQLVLNHFNHHPFRTQIHSEVLKTTASKMIQSQFRPKLIFNFMVDILRQKRIELPAYNTLLTIITDAIKTYDDNLLTSLDQHLSHQHKSALDKLLERTVNNTSDNQAYPITLLKYFNPTDNNKNINANVEKLLLIQSIYKEVHPLIGLLTLNGDAIRYYGELVIHYKVYQITRRSESSKYLLLLAFVTYQLYQFEDWLTDTLLVQCKTIFNQVRREFKDKELDFYDLNKPTISNLIGDYYDTLGRDKKVTDLLWADNQGLTAIQIIKQLRQLFPQEQDLEQMMQSVGTWKDQYETVDKNTYYDIMESQSLALQKKVAAIVKALHFKEATSDKKIMVAITEFKNKDGVVTKSIPQEFLADKDKAVIFNADGKFRISLFKMLLFDAICQGIKAGALNLSYSYRYKAFDEYLIAEFFWNQNQDALLMKADFEHLKSYTKVIEKLKTKLEAAYESTNQSILLDQNKFMRFRENGKFSVTTPKVDKEATEKLVDWFPNTKIIPLSEVLATVNRLTGYLDELVHIQPKYHKTRPRNALFYAGIMAYGCNVGIPTMTKVATPMSEVELENTVNAYFSLANVDKANDLIVEFTESLELPQIYKRHRDSLHTSSDGQKFGVKGNSIHSAYCYKYFKKGRGATAYSFIDERQLLWHSTVIDSFEREATYVIDGLMHNETIQSTIHSTDTHGYTEAVFALMNLLGFDFAKNIEYTEKGYKILPDGYINTELIEENWDNILRLITSIKLKECTASQIFRRLNSYSRQHPVYKGLKEFGKIVKTIFLLEYIDDVKLRQTIRKQLNKIENANRFSDVVRFANNGESIFPTRQEQLIAESSTRLIKNAIICWNYLYLSNQIHQAKTPERKKVILEAIKAGSIMAWQHIYFHGLYDFSDENLTDSFDLLASQNFSLDLSSILGDG